MAKDGLIENIRDNLSARRETNTHKQMDGVDRKLIKNFKDIKATKDIGLILEVEKTVLRDISDNYLFGEEIIASNSKALDDIVLAQATLEKVYDAETYQCVAEEHQSKDKSIEGRPKDQTRMFIKSHKARLKNEMKSVNTHSYLGYLNARHDCIRVAEKEYIKLQDKAMGREPEVRKSKSRGIER